MSDAGDRLQAAAHALSLIIPVFDVGFSDAVRERLLAYPELRDMAGSPQDADESAARHYSLLEHAVTPYEGAFRDAASEAGGRSAERVVRWAAGAYESALSMDRAADHLVSELRLAVMMTRAADVNLGRYLDEHLLSWLPGLVAAIEEEGDERYAEAGRLSLQLVNALRSAAEEVPGSEAEAARMPERVSDPLEDDSTGVRDLAVYFTTVASCGFFLGREGVSRLARVCGAPRGFGGRTLMMGNLFRSAASYDRMGDLTVGLIGVAERARAGWLAQQDAPGAGGDWARHWMAAIDRSISVARRLERALEEGPAE